MAKESMAKKPPPKTKRIEQPLEDKDAETESTSSASTRLPEQDQNTTNIRSTNPSASLSPRERNLANDLVKLFGNCGYNLGFFQLQLARHAQSSHSYPHSVVSSNNTEQEPAVSSLGKQRRTRLYQYRCIFKDSNGQCQARGRGPPEKVTRFICEDHTVQGEQEDEEDEKDEDYKDDGDEEDEEDEEFEYDEEEDEWNEELDDGEDGGDEKRDDGEDGGVEGKMLKGDEVATHNDTKLLRSGRRI